MTLNDTYQRFLDRPSQGALADKAALHYITTLTTISDAPAIIKHLQVQEKLLKKTKQQVVSVVEGRHALSVDVETTLEFLNGGGAYLPGLDDNFVADRTVTFPMVHIVHFDSADKITQIRQYWDQGSLLKQIDVIGARSRNWPIREGSEQAKLIKSSAQLAQPDSAPSSRPSTAARGADEVSIRSRGSTNNAMNDPHASLSLFERRQIEENELPSAHPTAPRVQSAKPPPREYSELFVNGDAGSPSPANQRIPVKGGANTKPTVNRLFEETAEERMAATTPSKGTKTNPNKYDHFTFGDGGDEDTPRGRGDARKDGPRGTSKSQASWGFEDFVTPEKTNPKHNPGTARNFSWEDNEVEESPARVERIHKARPGTGHQFEFEDEGTPVASKSSNENRRPGAASHQATRSNFGFYDESPKPATGGYKINIAGNGMGNRAGTQFSLFDEEEPKPAEDDRSIGNHKGIKATGDGMGGRKGAEKGFWDF